MKKNWKSAEFTICVLVFLFILSACGNKKPDTPQQGKTAEWQCPMKCEGEKTYPQAGSCPICKMDLKEIDNHESHKTDGLK